MGSSVILPPTGQPITGPDPTFVSAAVPNIVEFLFKGVGPPAALYLQRDDFILINASSNQPSELVQGEIRYLLPSPEQAGQPDLTAAQIAAMPQGKAGKIVTTQFTLQLSATPRTLLTKTFSLGECYLLAIAGSGLVAAQRGQTFFRASINRGGGTAGGANIAQMLVSDYLTQPTPVGWPGGRQFGSQESVGWLHTVNQPNPAAGADWTFTVPVSARMRVQSFAATFTASATVANRQVALFVDDGANVYWSHVLGSNITASQVATVTGTGTNAPTGVVATTQSFVIPPGLILPPGHRIRTVTTGIQAGDQWSAIWFGMEEWLDQI